jgi:nitrogen fixation/metabolism regulation signal transduction histidine kinase
VVAVFVGSLFANQIAAPVRRLIGATRRIAGGELDFRLKETRRDELGELYQAFNNMTEDLKRNREDLLRAEREMAWKEMAKQVAHEIKNPLTPMKLSIQHLRQAYLDNDKRFSQLLDQVVRGVTEQIDALSRIASEFAHFARMPRRREEMVDVNGLLHDTVSLFSQNQSVELRLQLSTQALAVRGDREELQRVFINVIRNAIQAFGERGTISITSEHNEGVAKVCITDTGPGIPENMRSKLFEPAFSTKTDGMGLGLAIVKKTIDDMRGTIEILSEEGRGTTVRMVFPLAVPEGE